MATIQSSCGIVLQLRLPNLRSGQRGDSDYLTFVLDSTAIVTIQFSCFDSAAIATIQSLSGVALVRPSQFFC